jgi:hypothetical protein
MDGNFKDLRTKKLRGHQVGECLPKFGSNSFSFHLLLKNVKLRNAVLQFCLMFCLVLKIGLITLTEKRGK